MKPKVSPNQMGFGLQKKPWTTQQDAIFAWFRASDLKRRALRVIARAGTGKTSTSVEAIGQAPEQHKLTCAFNVRNAADLKAKMPEEVRTATLNGVGFGLIQKMWPGTEINPKRGIEIARSVVPTFEQMKSRNLVWAVRDLADYGKQLSPSGNRAAMLRMVTRFGIRVDRVWDRQPEALVELALAAMKRALVREGAIDFNDQLFIPLALKMAFPMHDLVLVDEAQDLNKAQIQLTQRILMEGGRFVFVGDPCQTIYGFRGADMRTMDWLAEDVGAESLPLTVSFRCAKSVIRYAQGLVPDIEALPNAPEGDVLDWTEAQMLAEALPGDFILSRTNAPLMPLCLALLACGRPAKVEGRDVGKSLIKQVDRLSEEGATLSAFLRSLAEWQDRETRRALDTLDEEDASDHIAETKDTASALRALAKGCDTVDGLKGLISDLFTDGAKKAVVLSTVHKAKGQEADRVFVLRDTLYPRGKRDQEERNIDYVAATRARKTLVHVGAPAGTAPAPGKPGSHTPRGPNLELARRISGALRLGS